jgi:hypothetical protein
MKTLLLVCALSLPSFFGPGSPAFEYCRCDATAVAVGGTWTWTPLFPDEKGECNPNECITPVGPCKFRGTLKWWNPGPAAGGVLVDPPGPDDNDTTEIAVAGATWFTAVLSTRVACGTLKEIKATIYTTPDPATWVVQKFWFGCSWCDIGLGG